MKKGYKWLCGIAFATAMLLALPISAEAAGRDMYCLYNSTNKEFLYTIDENEKNNLISTWEYKGVICTLPESSSTPVYRLYDPASTQHLYTSDDAEINKLVSEGWTKEGIAYYVDDAHTAPVYRMFNPATGEHQFSGSAAHMSGLEASGWVKEGVAYYALSVNEGLTGAAVEPAVVWLFGNEVRSDNYETAIANAQGMEYFSDVIDWSDELISGKVYTCKGFTFRTRRYLANKKDYTGDLHVEYNDKYKDTSGLLDMNFKGVEMGATAEQIKAVWGEPVYETKYMLSYLVGNTCYKFDLGYKSQPQLAEVTIYYNCSSAQKY